MIQAKKIIGHQKQINFLKKIIKNDLTNQAYLFSGPEKVGKFTIAQEWAKAIILNQKFLAQKISSQKIISDLLILKPTSLEKKQKKIEQKIGVDEIREILKELTFYPSQGKYRVLIIDQAHLLTIQAQNALLKTIEEPNNTSFIILVTHQEKKILATIKSRCQIINFSLVSTQEMLQNNYEKEIVYFSMGRPGIAQEIKSSQIKRAKYQNFLVDLKNIFSANFSINQRFDLAEKLAKNEIKTKEMLDFWIWILWLKAHKEKSLLKKYFFYTKITQLNSLLEKISNSHANLRLQLENLFLNFSK